MAAFDFLLLEARARFRAGLHFQNYHRLELRGKSCGQKVFAMSSNADTIWICVLSKSGEPMSIMLPDHFSAYPQPLMKILLAFGVGLAIAALL